MSPEKLVTMANQIAAFFKAQGESKAPEAIADHIRTQWEPRMRREIQVVVRAGGTAPGGARIDPLAMRALEMLSAPAD
jgi:formate dehydrogenase subunit delta